jgi:hypothetical protein
MLLWDRFILEHKLANGRTVMEQFVAAHPQLPEPGERRPSCWGIGAGCGPGSLVWSMRTPLRRATSG